MQTARRGRTEEFQNRFSGIDPGRSLDFDSSPVKDAGQRQTATCPITESLPYNREGWHRKAGRVTELRTALVTRLGRRSLPNCKRRSRCCRVVPFSPIVASLLIWTG